MHNLSEAFSKLFWGEMPKIIPYRSVPDNVPFTQLFQHYPVLSPFYTEYEKNFHASSYVNFAQNTWPALPLALCGIYGLMIVVGTKVMESRPKHEWKTALACWNLLLSVFSFCGMLRTVPHLLHNVTTLPFKDTICRHPAETYGEGACGLWVMLFIYSKVPELVDTVFIVFRKSKLQFLHWYHHITVLLFCWHSYAVTSSTGLYFVAMNYSVHAVMYAYYYLTAIKAWPSWIPPSIITVAQISQMMVGVGICVASFYYLYTDPEHCEVKPQNVYSGALMYGSYLYLFCDFFVRRFLRGGKPRLGEERSAVLTMTKKIKDIHDFGGWVALSPCTSCSPHMYAIEHFHHQFRGKAEIGLKTSKHMVASIKEKKT
ncbi:fatty-acyl [Nannochloropsis gaditana]|uniref:Elongation of fatty acids protein n=1 Tax=Nannochloropsis gaditana TaxID=72520 RepID=W7TTK8_9STRA|nr:fatty-acyl [Nannochloropsis gaditana]